SAHYRAIATPASLGNTLTPPSPLNGSPGNSVHLLLRFHVWRRRKMMDGDSSSCFRFSLVQDIYFGTVIEYRIKEQSISEEAEEPTIKEPAPVSCDAFKSCLMRLPQTSDCLGNINAFFKENGISIPKIPPCLIYPPSSLTLPTTYPPSP
ncbi:hypothetical protein F7725_022542, partial [Dissostichus mawsoni]